MIFPTNALFSVKQFSRIKSPTSFGTHVPSSGIYCNEGVRAGLLIYVSFIVIGLIKTLAVITLKIYKNYIVNNLQCL